MKKIFTTGLILLSLSALSVKADYISAPMKVTPANETVMSALGMIDIAWKDVNLKVEDDNTAVKNRVDLSYVTVTLNGEVNTAWKSYMGAELYVHHIETSTEEYGDEGGQIVDAGYLLSLYLGDTAFFWKGEVKIDIAEGAVEDTQGNINAPISLTYFLKNATEPDQIVFQPETESEFPQGEGLIKVTWDIEGDLSINENSAYSIMALSYDEEGGVAQRLSLNNYCKIEDNALVISLESLAPGTYTLLIPEGCVFIGQDYMNLESVDYKFKVLGEPGELPTPIVDVLPSKYGWFDGFSVTWAEKITQPYAVQIVDASKITAVKNLVEEITGLNISTVEYQETDESPNYPDARLVVTLPMIEMEIGAYYTLNVAAGAVNVLIGSEAIPNEGLTYSFTLEADNNEASLPEPNVDPAEGTVNKLQTVKMSWTGKLGSLDLLNAVNDIEEEASVSPVTLTYNGTDITEPAITFEWSSREAVTPGAEGDILVISLTEETSVADGEYVLTIPAGYLQISDIETGTLYNEDIVLKYTVDSSFNSIGSIGIDKDAVTIYNINGVKVAGNSFDTLPKGVYIINGKKVIK